MAKEIILPEGWEVDKIENGKVILKEIKAEYPKTWEECMAVTKSAEYVSDISCIQPVHRACFRYCNDDNRNSVPTDYGKKIRALCQLLICRNAYWGNWVPNWKDRTLKYVIRINSAEVILEDARYYHPILAFPNREMRNAFYENFKDLIEEAKELL